MDGVNNAKVQSKTDLTLMTAGSAKKLIKMT